MFADYDYDSDWTSQNGTTPRQRNEAPSTEQQNRVGYETPNRWTPQRPKPAASKQLGQCYTLTAQGRGAQQKKTAGGT